MKRKTIFAGLSGGFGPAAQAFPVLKELKQDGFDIVCHSRSAKPLVLQSGFSFADIPAVDLPSDVTPKGAVSWDLDHYWSRYGYLDEAFVEALVTNYLEVIASSEPDLILSQFSPPTVIAAKKLGIPLISITQSCIHPKGKHGRLSWWETPPAEYPKVISTVNRVMKKHGLDEIERMEDLNQGDLTIVPSFPEFDPIESYDVRYIGPLLWEDEPSEEAREHRPDVFVYTGNLYDSAGASGLTILMNVVRAFRDTSFNVLISTGLNQDLTEVPDDLPDHITVTDWVPASAITRRCGLMIHHGGHGSCMLGLMNAVPSIVIPTVSEREYNARQLKELEGCSMIKPDEINPERLYRTSQHVYQNEEMIQSLKKWKKQVEERNYGGPREAAEHVAALVQGGQGVL